ASGVGVVRVTNNGTGATGALATALGGANGSAFALDTDGCTGQVLLAGQSCTVSLHLTPSSAGTPMATLTVSGSPGGAAVVMLQATVIPPGTISIAPPAKTFDPVVVGANGADVAFTVSSTMPTGTLSVMLGGSDAASFGVTADSCSGMTLSGAATCSISVRFQPAADGPKAASLLVSGMPGGTGVATLSGSGLAGATLSGPAMVDFSSVVVGNTSAESS